MLLLTLPLPPLCYFPAVARVLLCSLPFASCAFGILFTREGNLCLKFAAEVGIVVCVA
jgi:hypothetical protein